MDIIRSFSRRSFVLTMFFTILLLVVVKTAFFFGMNAFDAKISLLLRSQTALPETKVLVNQLSMMLYDIKFYFIPVSTLVFCLFGLLLWLFLRVSFVKLVKGTSLPEKTKKEDTAEKTPMDRAEKKHQDRRLFLHLIALLQREGRIVDFFLENLDLYEDAQIGAAVRNVHENCRNVINKNLSLKPVIDKNEGEEITVDPGFDPGAIKLTGNVTGEPPFRGILRHKGWQAKKLDLPTLSAGSDSSIIAPAEVEIL